METLVHYEKIEMQEKEKIKELSCFASEIIREHYDPIIGAEQNTYMIEMFQSEVGIKKQLEEGYLFYLLRREDGEKVGFICFGDREEEVYLNKFYMHKDYRGNGYGADAFRYVVAYARTQGKNRISLNVNKYNSASIAVYEKLGFKRVREEKNAIGHGYYMDDFVYAYDIPPLRLVAFDLDGTALTTEKTVPEELKECFEKARKKGIILVPATGRPLYGVPEEIRKMPEIPYIITSNGARIYQMPEEKVVYEDLLPKDKALKVLETIECYPVVPDCFIEGRGNMPKKAFDLVPKMGMSEGVKQYLLSDSRNFHENILDFMNKNEKGIEKITINFILTKEGKKQQGEEVFEQLSQIEHIHLVVGAIHNYEVSNETATKGNALKWISKEMQIPLVEIMAIGDEKNDVPMIQVAGFGVAMENGDLVAKNSSNYITNGNDDNGVAKVIEKFCLS